MISDPRPLPWWIGPAFVAFLFAFAAGATIMTETLKSWLDSRSKSIMNQCNLPDKFITSEPVDVQDRLRRIERDIAAVRAHLMETEK